MRDEEETIRRLSFENWVWFAFIVASAIDIYGDELIKKGIREHNAESQKRAENLFLFVILLSILIYVYFFYRNYKDYKKYHNDLYYERLVASAFILLGTIMLLYFQLNVSNKNNQDNLPSNI